MPDIKDLYLANLVAARAHAAAVSEQYDERRALLSDATHAIDVSLEAKYGERIAELHNAERAAKAAVDAAQVAEGMGKLAGYPPGIVVEWKRKYDRWQGKYGPFVLTGRRGRYEVRTSETQFAANIGSYRIPLIGDVFIRLLKKDGTAGLGFEAARSGTWLPEGQKPKAGTAP